LPTSSPHELPRPAPRIACVHLPHVAAALEERDDRALIGRPFVVAAERAGPPVVDDVSYTAHLLGVAPGMTVAEAEAHCPGLVVRPSRDADRLATFRAMLAALGEIADEVEPAGLEHAWLVAEPLDPRASEHTLAEAVAGWVRDATGIVARVGLAHGKLTSRVVAAYLHERAAMALPPGAEREFLGGLATRYLPLGARALEQLRQMGVTRVHQYAALPEQVILPRFGYAGLRAYTLAHGQDDARVREWTSAPMAVASHTFAEPVACTRNLRFRLDRLAHQVAEPLARRYRMAGELTVRLTFADGTVATRKRMLLEPLPSARALAAHAEAMVGDAHRPGSVAHAALGVRGLCPTASYQLALYRHARERGSGVDISSQQPQPYSGEGGRQGRGTEGALRHERRVTAGWRAVQ